MGIVNFCCEKCEYVFHTSKKNVNDKVVSRCPKCASIVAGSIVPYNEKKVNYRKVCQKCRVAYDTTQHESIICSSCLAKEKPFAKVFERRKLSKQELKTIIFIKNIERQTQEAKDVAEKLIYLSRVYNFTKEETKEVSAFVVKFITLCNNSKERKIEEYGKL